MLSVIERKVLGALMQLSNSDGVVNNTSTVEIAKRMGYKTAGGVISMALKSLEHENHISVSHGVKGRASMKVVVHV